MYEPMRIRLLLLHLLLVPIVQAQGVMQSLTIQGMQQQDPVGVRTRAMGGTFAAVGGKGPGELLLNPAGTSGIRRPALAFAGLWQSRDWGETQHWNPNRYYAGISLYFSDPETYRSDPLSEPDWSHVQSLFRPAFAGGLFPLPLGNRTGTLGLAWHLVADLSDYDRNDNVLDPYIGRFRPEPVERPKAGEVVEVTWSSFERQRTGMIQALSPTFAVSVLPRLHLGLRLSYWWGSSQDSQRRSNRGVFTLREDAHDYSFAEIDDATWWNGTSEYSGWTGTLGVRLEQHRLDLGVSYRLPARLTRTFHYQGTISRPEGHVTRTTINGHESIVMPFRLTAGAVIRPASALELAVDYFMQNYQRMDVAPPGSTDVLDWGGVRGVRLGLEWAMWKRWFLRAGFRQDPQPFRIEGSGLLGQTAGGNAFSAGFGCSLGPASFDMAYEFQHLLYQDRWESNVDYNRIRKHNILFGATWLF